jgi:hypothetical protein
MRYIAFVLFFLGVGQAWGFQSCPVTTGTLTLNVTQPRTSAISPALLFFDATTTTDTALAYAGGSPPSGTSTPNPNTYQDIYYLWDFGDSGVSGTGNWPNGATGQPQKNKATGPVAAHLYVLPTAGTTDTTYVVQLWAYDGTNVATCQVTVTVFAPSGTNGFPGANTICAAQATTPVAGAGGCPAGAAVAANQPTLSGALASFGSNKRVLLKCGDTFTGGYNIPDNAIKGSIGAYGGCENTTTSRPILSNSSGFTIRLYNINFSPTDIRFADLDFTDGGSCANAISGPQGAGQKEITIYNSRSTCQLGGFAFSTPTETGIIQSYATSANSNGFTLYLNYFGNHCLNNSSALYCGFASYNEANYFNVKYDALIGSYGSKLGTPSGFGAETLRIATCRFCVISNNTLDGAAPNWAATMAFRSAPWIGQFSEYNVVSDNFFTGASGGNLTEISSTDASSDERHRYVIYERNMLKSTSGANVGLAAYGAYMTVRNNVLYGLAGTPMSFGFLLQRRFSGTPAVVGGEEYNNTCYTLTTMSSCTYLDTPVTNSFAQNNLFYNNGSASGSVVNNLGGASNTVSNNTTNNSLNPNMKNGSGNFSLLSDFLPQANNTGAIAVPNYFDAFQLSWIGAYRLGALSPAAP